MSKFDSTVTEHFYSIWLDGLHDDDIYIDNDYFTGVLLQCDDIAVFPELEGYHGYIFYQDENGLVWGSGKTKQEYQEFLKKKTHYHIFSNQQAKEFLLEHWLNWLNDDKQAFKLYYDLGNDTEEIQLRISEECGTDEDVILVYPAEMYEQIKNTLEV